MDAQTAARFDGQRGARPVVRLAHGPCTSRPTVG